ncbi:MAG TPA: hypothetical protein VHZ51_27285 [Ktedonobacteraceae bacterium]|jgi:hypothetical protein|nr:hypothetical protein [Ktedonobacteraceae bacterium]
MSPWKAQQADFKPIFNVLEGHVEVLVVNAQHLKAVAFAQDRPQGCRMDR